MPVSSTKKILLGGTMLKAFVLGMVGIVASIAAIVHAHGRKPLPMLVPVEPPPAATEIPVPDMYLSPPDETPATQAPPHAGR